MDIRLNVKYGMELSREEWLVVSKALRAFADDAPMDEDREIAARLQEQMLMQKANMLEQMTREATKAVNNISSAKRGPKP